MDTFDTTVDAHFLAGSVYCHSVRFSRSVAASCHRACCLRNGCDCFGSCLEHSRVDAATPGTSLQPRCLGSCHEAVAAGISLPELLQGLRVKNPGLDNIQAGTVMLEESVLLPAALRLETERYSGSWRVVNGLDGFGVDRRIRKAGWSFIFVGGRINVLVLGWRRKGMIKRAMRRFLATVKSRWFNSAEITGLNSGFFLGISYVMLSGHSRQVQQGLQLLDAAQRQSAQSDATWACL